MVWFLVFFYVFLEWWLLGIGDVGFSGWGGVGDVWGFCKYLKKFWIMMLKSRKEMDGLMGGYCWFLIGFVVEWRLVLMGVWYFLGFWFGCRIVNGVLEEILDCWWEVEVCDW